MAYFLGKGSYEIGVNLPAGTYHIECLEGMGEVDVLGTIIETSKESTIIQGAKSIAYQLMNEKTNKNWEKVILEPGNVINISSLNFVKQAKFCLSLVSEV